VDWAQLGTALTAFLAAVAGYLNHRRLRTQGKRTIGEKMGGIELTLAELVANQNVLIAAIADHLQHDHDFSRDDRRE